MCTWIVSIGKQRKKRLELWVGVCTGLLDYDVYGSTSEQVDSPFFQALCVSPFELAWIVNSGKWFNSLTCVSGFFMFELFNLCWFAILLRTVNVFDHCTVIMTIL